jgi:hypothetical protein
MGFQWVEGEVWYSRVRCECSGKIADKVDGVVSELAASPFDC